MHNERKYASRESKHDELSFVAERAAVSAVFPYLLSYFFSHSTLLALLSRYCF